MSANDPKCGNCGHAFSAHDRDIYDNGGMKVDDALAPKKHGDIFSDKPIGESGCNVSGCECRRYTPVNY